MPKIKAKTTAITLNHVRRVFEIATSCETSIAPPLDRDDIVVRAHRRPGHRHPEREAEQHQLHHEDEYSHLQNVDDRTIRF
jgi:hypothetical protein